MRCRHVLGLSALLALASPLHAQQAAAPAQTRATLLSSRQIDRYHAIEQLNSQLKLDPKNLGNWILQGELSQEIANDLPSSQAKPYYTLARESYDNALKLDPNNAGLKAAADFARQHEQNASKLAQSRTALTDSYLSARRQELAQSNYMPSVPTFGSPTPSANPAPFGADVGAHPPIPDRELPTPYSYQPYVNAQGQPYTYDQYARMYSMPTENFQPMTTRGYYYQAAPRISPPQGATGVKPAPTAAPPE